MKINDITKENITKLKKDVIINQILLLKEHYIKLKDRYNHIKIDNDYYKRISAYPSLFDIPKDTRIVVFADKRNYTGLMDIETRTHIKIKAVGNKEFYYVIRKDNIIGIKTYCNYKDI